MVRDQGDPVSHLAGFDAKAEHDFYDRTWAEPSLDINGIRGGKPEFVNTTLVVEAEARFTVRLAPGQDPLSPRSGTRSARIPETGSGRSRRPSVTRSYVPAGRMRPAARRNMFRRGPAHMCAGQKPIDRPFGTLA